MPILNSIQRRSRGGRLLFGVVYALLTLGAAWMVYPFLLLLSGALKSETDIRHFDVFPKYLTDDLMLFRKFEDQRYGGSLDLFTSTTGVPLYSFEQTPKPPPSAPAVLADWREFLRGSDAWPEPFLRLGHVLGYRTLGEVTLEYQHRLAKAFPDLQKEEFAVRLVSEAWPSRSYQPVHGLFAPVYQKLRRDLPRRYFYPTSLQGNFETSYLRARYGTGEDGVEKLNARWGTRYASLQDAILTPEPPLQPGMREDWWIYVRDSLSSRFIRCAPSLLPEYRAFLRDKYRDLAAFGDAYGRPFRSWNDAAFPAPDARALAFSDFEVFLQTRKGPEGVSLDGPEFRWRAFLREKYGDDLAAFQRAHGGVSTFEGVRMPVFADDWQIMQEHKGAILRDFLTRNFRIVWDQLSVRGRAFQNTIIFCALAILTALIVNPLAAYALSRFQPRWGYKALFFLMATMAFPAEVTQIPNFLMLRELGLLNTFAALILPGAASGYSIFLLKGFFDSLPRDLYESANLDGASELRIFFTITLPLSKPILAVIALGAFTHAYGAFMFALLVCQKESMWTLMVYIYQLQMGFGPPVVFAALIMAAVPTLLVFVFCQNIIMRGIVVPVEK
ncbi:MAG: carbohydrate ABC transporter permease [Verrucomicrobiae bacterium]|nr:carbohydrate ABC transporter permease [Verrucomicrobiae bacterium]